MSGTVEQLKKHGVSVLITDTPSIGDFFQIYRIINEVEIIIGTGYIRKPLVPNIFKLQPPDKEDGGRGEQFLDVQVGDLIRKVD